MEELLPEALKGRDKKNFFDSDGRKGMEAIGELLGGSIRNSSPLRREQHTWRLAPDGGGALFVRTLQSADAVQFLLHRSVRAVAAHTGAPLRDNQVEEDVFGHFGCTGGMVIRFHDSLLLPHVPRVPAG